MVSKLEPHQIKGVRGIHSFNGRCIVADEMGLGKTIEAAGWAKANPHIRPVVVVCPAFVKDNWESEIRIHMGLRAQVLDGEKPLKRLPLHPPRVVIVNYDIVQYWLKYLCLLGPKLVVVDEFQNIKSMTSIRTRAVEALCEGVPHVIFLGGTGGLENRPVEIYPALRILHPKRFANFRKFANKFCGPRRRFWGWDYTGATNLDELHRMLKKICLIRRKQQKVLPDLPPQNRHIITLQLKGKDLDEYKFAEDHFKKWLQDYYKKLHSSRRGKWRRKLRAQALTKVGFIKRLAANLKLKYLLKWIDNFLASSNDKLILFFIHKSISKQLVKRYAHVSVMIDGATPRAKRRLFVDQFNRSKSKRLFIGQMQATNVGWSAKSSNAVAFVELGWRPTDHTQGEKRVHGMYRGIAGKESHAFYFVAEGTIEERIIALLDKKQKIIDAILDGKQVSDFNILKKLMQELANDSGKKRHGSKDR